ncbi:MAG: P1 family peptidase [Actinomycetota bacterium]
MTLVDGVTVGHWTDPEARTGCTVIRFAPAAVASGEIRGGAPASRDFALLDPRRTVERIDAVVLSGGSAFGLAAGTGVADALAEEGVGYETRYGDIPIVVGLSLYDLGVGDPGARPGPEHGRAALAAATPAPASGRVGAGTGATTGKWRGPDTKDDAGLGIATITVDDLTVHAIVAVNAVGDIDDGSWPDAVRAGHDVWPASDPEPAAEPNTVIGVVVTNAALDPTGCLVVAQGAHDGLARAIFPPHMRSDGDGFVAASVGEVDAPVDQVRMLAVVAVETAIRRSVGSLSG